MPSQSQRMPLRSPVRTFLSLVVFGLMSLSLALVIGSGAHRRFSDSSIDDPTLLWAGFGAFALAAVIALPARWLRPEWSEDSKGVPAWAWVAIGVMLAAGFVAGWVIDASN